jgi:hypothetical protein
MAEAAKRSESFSKKNIKDSVVITKEKLGKPDSRLLSSYLALYNSCQFLCWCVSAAPRARLHF